MEHGPRYRYALVIHARSVCECGHALTLKREARITASSPVALRRDAMQHCAALATI